MVLDILRRTNGKALAVSLKETIDTQIEITEKEGLQVCPEGATTFVALKKLKAEGWIRPDEKILLINTGNGLKYLPLIDVPKLPTVENEEDIPNEW